MPTALKLIQGNPGRRPVEKMIAPDIQAPPCPEHLSEEAKAEWGRIVPELMKLHLLTQVDMAALAMYCQSYGRWIFAEKNIAALEAEDEPAGYVISSPNGFPVQSPWLAIANKSMEQCKSFLVEFGMSPSSRSRVTASPQGDLFGHGENKTTAYF